MDRTKMGLIVRDDDGSEKVNYDDPQFPSYIYDGWIKPKVTWEKVPHHHGDIEMACITEGSLAYSVNGKIIELCKGDTIFINSHCIHYMMSTSEETARYVIFVIDPSVLMSSVAVEMQAIRPVIDNPELSYIRFRGFNEYAEEMFELMNRLPAIRHDPFAITREFFSIWSIILAQAEHIGLMDQKEEGDAHMLAFKAMMHCVSERYRENLTLDDIAGSANVSKSLCNSIFNKYVNESPVNYLMHFRVRKVAEYLRSTSYNNAQIAELTGFRGTSYMAETFRRYFGCSPREFRKQWASILPEQ